MFDVSLPWLEQITAYDPIWWEWERFDFKLRAVFMLPSTHEMNVALDEVERALNHIDPADYGIDQHPSFASIVVYFNSDNLDWLSILRLQTSADDAVQKYLMQIERLA